MSNKVNKKNKVVTKKNYEKAVDNSKATKESLEKLKEHFENMHRLR